MNYLPTDLRIQAATLPEAPTATPATAISLDAAVLTETTSLSISATVPLTIAVETMAAAGATLPSINPVTPPVTNTASQDTLLPYWVALPVIASTDRPSDPIDVSTESVQTVGSNGIWLSAAEIALLPIDGSAWLQVKAAADVAPMAPNLGDQDTNANVNYLAQALVFARLGDERYRQQVASALRTITTGNSEENGRTLALGRELAAYVIAADLIDLKNYDPTLDGQFRTKLRTLLTKRIDGLTLQETHEQRPNNWGSHAGASRAAIAAYLGDRAELERTWLVFRGYLGDRAAYSGFEYGDLDWQADAQAPVPINPVGAMKQGYTIDGALPEEMRRGGSFQWPPLPTGYAWEALQGAVVQAQILQRAGYPAWAWQDRALLRAVLFLKTINWPADGDDGWQPWLINQAYGTEILPALDPAEPGKNMGWTNWTHPLLTQPATATPTTTPIPPTATNTPVPPTATPTNTSIPPTATATNTPIPPTGTNTPVPPPTRTPGNQAPVVNAGTDQTITLPTNRVELSGSATDDNLPNPPARLTLVWSKVRGPGIVTLSNANAAQTTANFSAAGVYALRFIVSDGIFSASDDLEITVVPANAPAATPTPLATFTNTPLPPTATFTNTPLPPTTTATDTPIPPTTTTQPTPLTTPLSTVNQAPLVNAGIDQSITLPTTSVSLTGSATDDALPNPPALLHSVWSKVSGPGMVTFGNSNALNSLATFSQDGLYTVRLIASDGAFSVSDDVQITVHPSPLPSLTFAPTDDSGVASGSPTSNFGMATTYRARSGSSEYRFYLKFNVTGLNRPIQSAKLRLYVTDGSDSGGVFYPVAHNLFNANISWSESNLTWANAPLLAGPPLRTLGAVSLGSWVEVDVTPAITGNGTYSFAVKTASTDSIYYSSKEGKNPPQLLIVN